MADNTNIEWADATINPIRAHRIDIDISPWRRIGWHCEHVSEACRNCYAEVLNRDRFGTGLDYKPGHLAAKGGTVEIVLAERALTDTLRWRRPRRIFVCSMTDLFADFVPDWMIDRIFAAMALAPHHTFMLLTKRPERMRAYLASSETFYRVVEAEIDLHRRTGCPTVKDRCEQSGLPWTKPTNAHDWWPLRNVWLGVTAEDQATADERIPILLETPAAKRFVSVEPMLGAVSLSRLSCADPAEVAQYERGEIEAHGGCYIDALTGDAWDDENGGLNGEVWGDLEDNPPHLDWVICGGESGPSARPMHPDWVRSLRDQCAAGGVPFMFKQWGEWVSVLDRDRDDPDWRADYTNKFNHRDGAQRWLNVAGGMGFHGDGFHVMRRVGKRAAGRSLDGVEHLAFPET